jgi:hypothetical protein
MNLRRIWRGFLWLFCAGVAVAVLGLIGMRVERHILRNRAEALMADMQSITLRQTSFQQVQPIFRRWRKWGSFEGPCSSARCEFNIDLHDLNSRPDRYLYRDVTIFKLASLVGESPTAISARIGVLDGVVWSEQIGFAIEPPGNLLEGNATSVSRIDPPFASSNWQSHPEYTVQEAANLPDDVRLEFTPFANAEEIHHLMAINFSCLTRWHPCQTKNDIMPAFLADIERWGAAPRRSEGSTCATPDPLMVELLGRDSPTVVVVGVSSNQTKIIHDGGRTIRGHLVTFDVRDVLKLQTGQKKVARFTFFPEHSGLVHAGPFETSSPGTRFIAFFNGAINEASVNLGCQMPATPANLALVRKGVAEDDRPPGLLQYGIAN